MVLFFILFSILFVVIMFVSYNQRQRYQQYYNKAILNLYWQYYQGRKIKPCLSPSGINKESLLFYIQSKIVQQYNRGEKVVGIRVSQRGYFDLERAAGVFQYMGVSPSLQPSLEKVFGLPVTIDTSLGGKYYVQNAKVVTKRQQELADLITTYKSLGYEKFTYRVYNHVPANWCPNVDDVPTVNNSYMEYIIDLKTGKRRPYNEKV